MIAHLAYNSECWAKEKERISKINPSQLVKGQTSPGFDIPEGTSGPSLAGPSEPPIAGPWTRMPPEALTYIDRIEPHPDRFSQPVDSETEQASIISIWNDETTGSATGNADVDIQDEGLITMSELDNIQGEGEHRQMLHGTTAPQGEIVESILGSITRETNIGNYTDSGYASLPPSGALPAPSEKQAVPGRAAITLDESAADADNDAATVYSVAWSIPEAELDTYKSELAETILKNIQSAASDSELLRTLLGSLPALLKAFALRLGSPGSNKTEREVMFFVHKHRM